MATNSYKVYQEINATSGCESTILCITDESLCFSVSTLLSEFRICANALALSHCILGRGSSFASLMQKTVGLRGDSIVQVRNTYRVLEV